MSSIAAAEEYAVRSTDERSSPPSRSKRCSCRAVKKKERGKEETQRARALAPDPRLQAARGRWALGSGLWRTRAPAPDSRPRTPDQQLSALLYSTPPRKWHRVSAETSRPAPLLGSPSCAALNVSQLGRDRIQDSRSTLSRRQGFPICPDPSLRQAFPIRPDPPRREAFPIRPDLSLGQRPRHPRQRGLQRPFATFAAQSAR